MSGVQQVTLERWHFTGFAPPLFLKGVQGFYRWGGDRVPRALCHVACLIQRERSSIEEEGGRGHGPCYILDNFR